jgi:sterol 14-demethylase
MNSIFSSFRDIQLLVGAAVGFFSVFVFFNLLTGRKRPRNAPPNAHVGLPLIGNYVGFASNPVKFVEDCMNKFGKIYTVPMLHKRLTFLLGPEVSTPFFKLTDDYMSQPEVYGFMTPVFGKNVVYDAEPKKRIQQMQKMATGLTSHRLRAYIPKIEKETIDYLSKWGDSGTINILDALSELTILTASRCLHGDDVRETMFGEVARIYHDLDKGVTPLSFFFPYAPIPAHAMRDKARAEMVELFSKVIRTRRENQKGKDASENTDILQVFMDLKYKDGSVLNEDEIVGLLIALLFAGQHTSSITSTWTSMFLLHNKGCLDKVMKEQAKVLNGNNNAPLDFDSVGNMEYLQNAVKESLRLHPPLILLMRMAMKDIETTSEGKTFTIPKGDIVVTSPAVASRIDTVFKDPNEFQPERFGPERNEQREPYAYLGFGAGLHACMGQQFGLLQVKTILSILFRNFDFTPVDEEFPEPDYTAMVVGPKNHCTVTYQKKATSFV